MSLILKTLSLSTNGDPALGSLNFRKNYDTAVSPPFDVEHEPASTSGVLVPSSLQGNFHVYAEVFNGGDETVDASLTASETSMPHLLGNVTFPLTRFPAQAVTRVTGRVNPAYLANFGASMRKVSQTWHWEYTVVGVAPAPLGDTTASIYLLPALPVAAYGRAAALWDPAPGAYAPANIRYIWTELLDVCAHACDLYEGVLGHRPATQAEHMEAFVYELNQNAAFHYDVWSGASAYTLKVQNYDGVIKLKKYLRDRAAPYWNCLNCTDCATITAIEALACGFPAYTGRMRDVPPNNGFDCNPIIAIGCTAWEKPFLPRGGFSYHEVAVSATPCNENTLVYDACLKLDNGDYPSVEDPRGKTPVLSLGMSFAETAAPNVNVPPGAPYAAHNFYRERLVVDRQTCFINAEAYVVTGFNNILNALPPGEREEDFAALRPVMRRYCLTENPLPDDNESGGAACKGFERLPELPGLHALGGWMLKEDNGVQRVYSLTRDHKDYEVSFLKTESREEAWLRLVMRLSCISHPGVEPIKLGDCGFGIQKHWRLFVYKNMLIEVASPGYDAASLSPDILSALES